MEQILAMLIPALVTAAMVVLGLVLKDVLAKLKHHVRKSETKIDDALFDAVVEALRKRGFKILKEEEIKVLKGKQ
jgi:DUF1009 family protein